MLLFFRHTFKVQMLTCHSEKKVILYLKFFFLNLNAQCVDIHGFFLPYNTVSQPQFDSQPKSVNVLLLQVVKSNQFSVTRHEKVANGLIGDQGLPGVFVLYELSPMMVKFTEKHRSETHCEYILLNRILWVSPFTLLLTRLFSFVNAHGKSSCSSDT